MSSPARIENLPKQLEQKWVRILGVDYLHLVLDDGSDLYLTEHGLPFAANLLPENYWTDKDWFHAHSVKLPGSSTLYKIETKPVGGVSKPIVLKWSRMGQDIPGETEVSDLAGARFNSPFEEFGLVRELRSRTNYGARSVYTHKPLAIYVPRQIVEPERMGRKSYWMKAVQKKHREVALDPKRRYAVIYEWVKGIDAVAAWKAGLMEEKNARRLVKRSNREMAEKGFRVRDSKPHHLIVRPADNNLARDRDGRLLYALVDFELLERTPEHEEKVRALRRRTYLERQAHRFESHEAYQTRLSPVRLMDVDYVFGPVESTGGALWVVGNDPELFDYFLPERWRESPKTNLSSSGNTYETTTKDDIHLVCRVSKVGSIPPTNELNRQGIQILSHGYNSPFEEISLNFYLSGRGINTTYPRAIYMSGHRTEDENQPKDQRRYKSHQQLLTPEGHPILSDHHKYVLIWGYWNGPDELLAENDQDYFRSLDAQRAREENLISGKTFAAILRKTDKKLRKTGVKDLDLKGSHLLLSIDRNDEFLRDDDGLPTVRICNFELIQRIDKPLI